MLNALFPYYNVACTQGRYQCQFIHNSVYNQKLQVHWHICKYSLVSQLFSCSLNCFSAFLFFGPQSSSHFFLVVSEWVYTPKINYALKIGVAIYLMLCILHQLMKNSASDFSAKMYYQLTLCVVIKNNWKTKLHINFTAVKLYRVNQLTDQLFCNQLFFCITKKLISNILISNMTVFFSSLHVVYMVYTYYIF